MKINIIDLLFNQKKKIELEGEVKDLVEQLKKLLQEVVFNTETNTLEVGGNLEVDGDVNIDSYIFYIWWSDSEKHVKITKYPPNEENSSTACIKIDFEYDIVSFGYWDVNEGNFVDEHLEIAINGGVLRIFDTSKIRDLEDNLILKNLEDAVSGDNTVELTFTEDDYNQYEGVYLKRVELNNCFIKISADEILHPEAELYIYCPYFKGILQVANPSSSFSGIESEPSERYVSFQQSDIVDAYISIFNGLVSIITTEV